MQMSYWELRRIYSSLSGVGLGRVREILNFDYLLHYINFSLIVILSQCNLSHMSLAIKD